VVATNAAGTSYSGTTYPGSFGILAIQTIVPAGWPDVTTSVIPSSVTANSAVLGGFVVSTSQPVTVYFEYDTDTNFANALKTPNQLLSPTNGSGFNATLTGLSPATDYFFRAVATNANGKGTGIIGTWRTLP